MKLKILIAGPSWHHPMYESAWKLCLEKLGHKVIPFSLINNKINLLFKLENKYSIKGLINLKINNDLIRLVEIEKPDIVYIWIGTNIFKDTLEAIKIHKCKIFMYIHDDPFTHLSNENVPSYLHFYYKNHISSIHLYDHIFYSKILNVNEALKLGARSSSVLMQYYVPELHYPIQGNQCESIYQCDIAFAGHYESDNRDEAINALSQMNLTVNVYGDSTWKKSRFANSHKINFLPRAFGSDYQQAICGAKLCLCFMSKINRDEYTTRCFEIPAMNKLLLSERTEALSNIFTENIEAVFFSSIDELKHKAQYLLNNPNLIEQISNAGRKKVIIQKHFIEDRVLKMLETYKKLLLH